MNKTEQKSKPIFEVKYSAEYHKNNSCADIDKYEIKINKKGFPFLEFLIDTSNMYWNVDRDLTNIGCKCFKICKNIQRSVGSYFIKRNKRVL